MEHEFCCGICSYNKPVTPEPLDPQDPLAWVDHCEFNSDPKKQFVIKNPNVIPENCPIRNIIVPGPWR